jgi:predicted GNAT superfamily acetyltransferase
VLLLSKIEIRDILTHSEYREVEELQKEIWEFEERDIVPLSQMIAAKETGAILLGAFDRSTMVGFVYGFVGYEHRCVVIHSHMLAVKENFRGENLGFLLKLAQREQALAQGIKVITWTFDPLQSLNAHLNIEKLGVVAVAYKVDFYGESTSPLHSDIGTDRLWARWDLESSRTLRALKGEADSSSRFEEAFRVVRSGRDGLPCLSEPDWRRRRDLAIEVPGEIDALKMEQPERASRWRELTRKSFIKALEEGYLVTGFHRFAGPGGPQRAYILTFGIAD